MPSLTSIKSLARTLSQLSLTCCFGPADITLHLRLQRLQHILPELRLETQDGGSWLFRFLLLLLLISIIIILTAFHVSTTIIILLNLIFLLPHLGGATLVVVLALLITSSLWV